MLHFAGIIRLSRVGKVGRYEKLDGWMYAFKLKVEICRRLTSDAVLDAGPRPVLSCTVTSARR